MWVLGTTFAKCTIVMTTVLTVTSGLGSSFDWMVWCGMVGMVLDHTLRILIQLNWVVLAYNFNFREWMLMNHESSIGAFLLTTLYFIYIIDTLVYHLFLHLLSTNHKCTQPCYFSPTTQIYC
jgi:hypothetical protein